MRNAQQLNSSLKQSNLFTNRRPTIKGACFGVGGVADISTVYTTCLTRLKPKQKQKKSHKRILIDWAAAITVPPPLGQGPAAAAAPATPAAAAWQSQKAFC